MKLVIDASVAVAASASPIGFARFRAFELVAPPLLMIEVTTSRWLVSSAAAWSPSTRASVAGRRDAASSSGRPSCSADRFFGKLTDKAIRRGVFHSVPDLITAIDAYLATTNENPTPFVWTQTAEQILEKVRRGRVALAATTKSPTKAETAH